MMIQQVRRQLIAGLLFCTAANGFTQVSEQWQINISNASTTMNDWLALPNRGHSIAFIAGTAPQNHLKYDLVALMTDETQTAPIRLLAASGGYHVASFNTLPTYDSFRDHARMDTSDNGYIYIAGSSGTVHRYKPNGSDHRVTISSLVYPSGSGTCRAFAVTGSESQGTLKLYVARDKRIFIFGNSPASPNTISLLGTLNTGVTGDLMTVAAWGNRVYAASINSPQLRMFEVTFSPFSYTDPVFLGPNALKHSAALNGNGNLIAMTLIYPVTGDECMVGMLDPTGTAITTIPALSHLDRNNNGNYDGGSRDFATYGATSDVCFNPATNEIFGYHPHSSPTPGQRISRHL